MSIQQDVHRAFRLLRRTPVPTAIALLSIALSVGATAVVFAAIESVLIDPLPYARPADWYSFAVNSLAYSGGRKAIGSFGMTPGKSRRGRGR